MKVVCNQFLTKEAIDSTIAPPSKFSKITLIVKMVFVRKFLENVSLKCFLIKLFS